MRTFAAIALFMLWHAAALAQQGAPAYARMVVIVPKPGQADNFEKGYERHLEWHKQANDPWTWYGWTFVLGDRIGSFMDGTFGHRAADFDAAVQPAADAADNAVNVVPYADFTTHGVWQRMDAMGAGAPLPDTSPFLALTTYHVRPGQEAAFEQAVARGGNAIARATWYRLRIGGPLSRYVLLRAVPSFGAAALLDTPYLLPGVVDGVDAELLRYRPNLSYHPARGQQGQQGQQGQ